MAICPACGVRVNQEDIICPECGQVLPTEGDGHADSGGWHAPVDETRPQQQAGADGEPRQHRDGVPAASPEPAARFGRRFLTGVSLVTSLIAVFFLPPLFGGISIFVGYRVYRQYARPLGTLLMALGVVATVVGVAIGVLLFF